MDIDWQPARNQRRLQRAIPDFAAEFDWVKRCQIVSTAETGAWEWGGSGEGVRKGGRGGHLLVGVEDDERWEKGSRGDGVGRDVDDRPQLQEGDGAARTVVGLLEAGAPEPRRVGRAHLRRVSF